VKPIEIQATDQRPIELQLSAPAADVDEPRRIIEGIIATPNESGVATVDGAPREIRFRAGSLVPERERTPLVLEHDQGAPIGVLASIAETDEGTFARFAIDRTAAGDEALVQAASGSRAGFSAGALADEYIEAADGILEVIRGRIRHVGLCTVSALPGAQVSSVAATAAGASSQPGRSSAMNEQEIRALIEGATSDEELAELLQHEDEGVRSAATEEQTRRQTAAGASTDDNQTTLGAEARSAERPVILTRSRDRAPELLCSAGELVLHMARANAGNRDSARMVEAVLTAIDSTDVPGLMPANYVNSLLEAEPIERPLFDRVTVTRPMPETGMEITKPNWTTKPDGGWVAELADIPSNAPAIGTGDVAILEWAYGVAMSYAVATRSSPDAIETIYRAAVEDYYGDVEQKIADLLMANDQPGGAGAGVGAAIAAFFGDVRKRPNLLVVAPDIYGDLVDETGDGPVWSGGEVSGASMTGVIAGLEIVVSAHLPAGAELVTRRGVIETRETNPIRLTADVIGSLRVELGVTSFYFQDLEEPNGIHSLTPAAGAPAGSSEAKRSSKKKGSGSEGKK
jgi:hypothetical protein